MGDQTEQFFRRAETREAIEELSGESRLTLVVGAGASAEMGYPQWSTLIERLLLRALQPEAEPADEAYSREVREAARRAIEESGLMGAATMARAALDDRFIEELRVCLYGWADRWRWDLPGATAGAVAELYETMTARGENCEVATTNYDLNLELAMKTALEAEVEPCFSDAAPREGGAVVRHLHGLLTPDGEERQVALTEADYHAAEAASLPWQEAYLRRRFAESTVVFVGASLTDQDLLSYIFRHSHEDKPKPVALLVGETGGDGAVDEHRSSSTADDLLESLEQGRWDFAHVKALHVDFQAQPAQFLHEIVHHKRSAEAVRYGERLDAWFRAAYANPLGLLSTDKFCDAQRVLQGVLADWVVEIERALEERNYDLSDETLHVHLWCRMPDRIDHSQQPAEGTKVELTSLAMMGCSDRTWNDPRAMHVRLITQPSSRAAVDAFCAGTPKIEIPSGRPKWHWILATPVVLEDDKEYGRLPVGAVTLVSSRDLDESVLGKLRARDEDFLRELERFLATAAESALRP
jgi:hypothetical protein